jgi:hypothetical protein
MFLIHNFYFINTFIINSLLKNIKMDLRELTTKIVVELENDSEAKLIDKDAVATARTTISFKSVDSDKVDDETAKRLLKRLINPGHLTPFLNRNLVYNLDGVSRTGSTWLHHLSRYYNSGHSSQRYLKLSKKDEMPKLHIPNSFLEGSPEIQEKVLNFLEKCHSNYLLIQDLFGSYLFENNLVEDFEAGKKVTTQYARDIFPGGVIGPIKFTTNIIQLGRLFILANNPSFEMPEDIRIVLIKMWALASVSAPNTTSAVKSAFESFIPPEIEMFKELDSKKSYDFYDKLWDENSNDVKLVYSNISFAERFNRELKILGINKNLEESNELHSKLDDIFFRNSFGIHNSTPIGQAFMNLSGLGIYTKMSHSHLEQSARHRGITHNVNLILPLLSKSPRFLIPYPFKENEEIITIFKKTFDEFWQLKDYLLEKNISLWDISFLLPRGAEYLVSMTGNWGDWRHYLNLRTCSSAQFHINVNSVKILNEFKKLDPYLPKIGPKCLFTEFCPEGPRSCGLFPWKNENGLNGVIKDRTKKGF